MTTFGTLTWRGAVMSRWVGRIAGTLLSLFFLAFMIGQGLPSIFRLVGSSRSRGRIHAFDLQSRCNLYLTCNDITTAYRMQGVESWGTGYR